MQTVANTDLVSRVLGRWCPTDVAYVRRVSFACCDADGYDLNLLLLLQPRPPSSAGWPDPRAPYWEALVTFFRVRDLKLTIVGPSDLQTPGFDIEDVSDRQWEGIGLRVIDYEQITEDGITFNARSAEVRWCRPARFPPNAPGVWREYPMEYPGRARD